MNAEWLRYYIAAKLNAHVEDIEFNPDDFVARVNSDLVGKYVNIASRAANFINKRFAGELRFAGDTAALDRAGAPATRPMPSPSCYEAREYGKALRDIMAMADRINADFDAAQPWVLAKDAARSAELQDICSRALHGFQLLSVLLAPVLPALARRVARELFGARARLHLGRCRAVPSADRAVPAPDAAGRSEAARRPVRAAGSRRSSPTAEPIAVRRARRRGDRGDDRHRRLRQGRPAHRPDRRLREGRGLDQAAEADARRRRGEDAHRLQRHPVGLRAGAAGRQADRAGRQPGAAQDEVRRQRRHGARRLARRREGAARASSSSSRTPARCRACASAEPVARCRTTSASVDIVRRYDDSTWGDDGPTRGVEAVVEAGHVLAFPRLAFVLADAERRFLDPRWADAKAKNVSVRWPSGELRGAVGAAADLAALRALVVRFAEQSEAFALRLFPHYRGHLRRGNTSFRPTDVAGRVRSWRQDDTRLHVDAVPVQSDAGHAPAARLLQRQSERRAAPLARRRAVRGACAPLPRLDQAGAAGLGLADGQARHHQAAAHGLRPPDAAAARPRQGRPRVPALEPAGARRLRARARPGSATATRSCMRRWAASTCSSRRSSSTHRTWPTRRARRWPSWNGSPAGRSSPDAATRKAQQ